MSWSEEIIVIIPCLNEARTIGPLVSEIRRHLPNVLVINDGSADATAAEAAHAGARIIHHREPRGKGSSLREAFAYACDRGFSWALAMDGDGQHSPRDIPAFLRAAESSSASMLVGNRMQNARCMPFIRRVVNRAMSRILANLCAFPIPDSQCGFRLLDLHAWNRLRCSSDHFEIESEMIVRFLQAGHKIDFIPIETRYGSESSKIRPLKDTLRWLHWCYSIRNELSSDVIRIDAAQPRYDSTPQDAAA